MSSKVRSDLSDLFGAARRAREKSEKEKERQKKGKENCNIDKCFGGNL